MTHIFAEYAFAARWGNVLKSLEVDVFEKAHAYAMSQQARYRQEVDKRMERVISSIQSAVVPERSSSGVSRRPRMFADFQYSWPKEGWKTEVQIFEGQIQGSRDISIPVTLLKESPKYVDSIKELSGPQ